MEKKWCKSGEELFEWMKRNGYEAELREATRRHICVALLADFAICLALVCSQGQTDGDVRSTRKPLKENLYFSGCLLIRRLQSVPCPVLDPTDRPLPNVADLKPDAKKATLEIISKAMNIITFAWISQRSSSMNFDMTRSVHTGSKFYSSKRTI